MIGESVRERILLGCELARSAQTSGEVAKAIAEIEAALADEPVETEKSTAAPVATSPFGVPIVGELRFLRIVVDDRFRPGQKHTMHRLQQGYRIPGSPEIVWKNVPSVLEGES